MKIAINAVLAFEKPIGVGNYVNALLEGLNKLSLEDDFYIYYGEWMKYSFLNIKNTHIHFIVLKIKKNIWLRNFYLAFIFPLEIVKQHYDVVHYVDSTPVFFHTCPVISTIHDLSEFTEKNKYKKSRALIRRFYVNKQAKKSDIIITVSEYSKKIISKILKQKLGKIFVTYNAFYIKKSKLALCSLNKNKRTLLFVGVQDKAKNIICLLKALKLLPNIYNVVLIGQKGTSTSEIIKIIAALRLEKRVTIKGYVDDTTLEEAYRTSFAFVFPSLSEGFGIPLIEAMSYGLPVLSSNFTCLPEIGGDACLYFNPLSPIDLKNKVLKLNNSTLYDSLKKRGLARAKFFSPEKLANETLHIYHKINKFKN